MTQNKETKQAAFKAWGMIERDIVTDLSMLIKKYEDEMQKGATLEQLHAIFEDIDKVCLVVIMKRMNKDPLAIIEQLDEIEKAYNIIKPTKS